MAPRDDFEDETKTERPPAPASAIPRDNGAGGPPPPPDYGTIRTRHAEETGEDPAAAPAATAAEPPKNKGGRPSKAAIAERQAAEYRARLSESAQEAEGLAHLAFTGAAMIFKDARWNLTEEEGQYLARAFGPVLVKYPSVMGKYTVELLAVAALARVVTTKLNQPKGAPHGGETLPLPGDWPDGNGENLAPAGAGGEGSSLADL